MEKERGERGRERERGKEGERGRTGGRTGGLEESIAA